MFHLLSVSCPPPLHEQQATDNGHLERGFNRSSPHARRRVRITCLDEEEDEGFENEEDEDLDEFDEGFYDDEDDEDLDEDEEEIDDDEIGEEDDEF